MNHPHDSANQAEVWTRHWASGAMHSCVGSYDEAMYGGCLTAFWQRAFGHVRPGDTLLDIATGAGAVPRLLCAHRSDIAWRLHAVDVASIAPGWVSTLSPARRACLTFHPGTAAEALPFGDHSFDGIVSHYGVEYAQRDAVWREMARVLRPQGWVAMVLHHHRSRPVRLAAIEVRHIEWLRSTHGYLDALRDMIEPLARAATSAGRTALSNDAHAERLREHFSSLQDALSQRLDAQPDGADVLADVRSSTQAIVARALTPDAASAATLWSRVVQQLDDAAARLAALAACALSTEAAGLWKHEVERMTQRPAELNVLQEGEFLMGWSLLSTA